MNSNKNMGVYRGFNCGGCLCMLSLLKIKKMRGFIILLTINWIAVVVFTFTAIEYIPGASLAALIYSMLNIIGLMFYIYFNDNFTDWFRTKKALEEERAKLVELVFDYNLMVSRLHDYKREIFKMKENENESTGITQSVSNDT